MLSKLSPAAYLSLKSCTDLCIYVKLAEGVSLSDVTFMVDGMVLDQNLLKMEKVNGSDPQGWVTSLR